MWYDNEMPNRSTPAMEEGVKHSAHFVLFLSGDPQLVLVPAAKEGVMRVLSPTRRSSAVVRRLSRKQTQICCAWLLMALCQCQLHLLTHLC